MINCTLLVVVFELTVDEYVGGGLELPALSERPVPDGAAVGGAVVLLGGHDREDGPDLKGEHIRN